MKNPVAFIGEFENTVVRYAKQYGVDGLVRGHMELLTKLPMEEARDGGAAEEDPDQPELLPLPISPGVPLSHA